MRFSILSLFPDYFRSPFDESMLKRAREQGLIEIELINIRDFADGRVDDRPYGGGPGMVLMAEPVKRAVESVPKGRCIYLSPQGRPLNAAYAKELAQEEHLVLLCGHYEGVDERAIESMEEVSIGDYVLTSGCPAAIVCVDAVARFVPGVVGHEEATAADSFEEGRFDWPHYTRPPEGVPEVLLSGHHQAIAAWRRERAEEKTKRIRPEGI